MKICTLSGHVECEVIKNPIREKLDILRETLDLKDDDLKFYFILDKYIYYNVDKNTGNKEKIFDTGFYTIKCDLKFNPNSENRNDREIVKKNMIKLFSLHSLVLDNFLPFMGIGITNNSWCKLPAVLHFKSDNDFILYYSKDRWENLQNDFDLLNKNIFKNKYFEKILIWYTFGKLSIMNIDKFMHYYRCFEELARFHHKNATANIKSAVDKEFPGLKTTKRDRIARVPSSNLVELYLNAHHIDSGIISQISDYRNKKIAHGNDYEIEYNYSLKRVLDKMEDIIYGIICKQIKELDIKGLKSSNFLRNYEILINESEKKIVLVYSNSDHIFGLDNWNLSIALHRLSEKEDILKYVKKELKECSISVNESIIEEIINNPEIIIDY